MVPSKEFQKQLRDELVTCFDTDGMRLLVQDAFNMRLEEISALGPLPVLCQNVIDWAVGSDGLRDLVHTAVEQRPRSAVFAALLGQLEKKAAAPPTIEAKYTPSTRGNHDRNGSHLKDRRTVWLTKHNLKDNPFAELNLPNLLTDYTWDDLFVSPTGIDEKLAAIEQHCIVFGANNQGKTTLCERYAADCWPVQPMRQNLVVRFHAQALTNMVHDCGARFPNIDSRDFAASIVLEVDRVLQSYYPRLVSESLVSHRHDATWRSLLEMAKAFHARSAPDGNNAAGLPSLEDYLREFYASLPVRSINAIIVLVDGVFRALSDHSGPATQCDFLQPVLIDLEIFNSRWLRVLVFASRECEAVLRSHRWYPERVESEYLDWTPSAILDMLNQRLRAFRIQRGKGPTELDELCEQPALREILAELADTAELHPLNALRLAGRLIEKHCEREAERMHIARATWDIVRHEWEMQSIQKLSQTSHDYYRCGPGAIP